MNSYAELLQRIREDERYQRNIRWGQPRPGHPEGSVAAHIADLESNLERLRSRLSEDEYWKLKVLAHVHDTFKAEAPEGIPIHSPQSHASLARAFLAEFGADDELLTMVQLHDEAFAMFQRVERGRSLDKARLESLLGAIRDWDLYIAFLIIDGGTPGEERASSHLVFPQDRRPRLHPLDRLRPDPKSNAVLSSP